MPGRKPEQTAMIEVDKNGEPTVGLVSDKAPERADSLAVKAMKKGAKWGAVAGLIGAQWYLAKNSPLGFYAGNVLQVFAIWIGLGVGLGVAIGWLSVSAGGADVPPPSFPCEPLG
jgi:hypothetical protein